MTRVRRGSSGSRKRIKKWTNVDVTGRHDALLITLEPQVSSPVVWKCHLDLPIWSAQRLPRGACYRCRMAPPHGIKWMSSICSGATSWQTVDVLDLLLGCGRADRRQRAECAAATPSIRPTQTALARFGAASVREQPKHGPTSDEVDHSD